MNYSFTYMRPRPILELSNTNVNNISYTLQKTSVYNNDNLACTRSVPILKRLPKDHEQSLLELSKWDAK
jgi:hypothetical protein